MGVLEDFSLNHALGLDVVYSGVLFRLKYEGWFPDLGRVHLRVVRLFDKNLALHIVEVELPVGVVDIVFVKGVVVGVRRVVILTPVAHELDQVGLEDASISGPVTFRPLVVTV